jgi:toxin HigB-1
VRLQLGRLDAAKVPQDMNLPGWKFHPLGKDLARHYAVTVNKNWRLTFAFEQAMRSWSTTRTITDKE